MVFCKMKFKQIFIKNILTFRIILNNIIITKCLNYLVMIILIVKGF